MSWLSRLLSGDPPVLNRIGPGRLVLVVGPSGAGKDTLINSARTACRDDSDIVFPRRIVTRPASSAEDHDTVSDAAFVQAVTDGAFAIWWSAHGLQYGIPLSIDSDIRAERTVVCNVSRTVVGAVRERYARVAVVIVTAPQEVLAARLTERGRSSDGDVKDRTQRSVAIDTELKPDLIIENVDTVESAARNLLQVISDRNLILGL